MLTFEASIITNSAIKLFCGIPQETVTEIFFQDQSKFWNDFIALFVIIEASEVDINCSNFYWRLKESMSITCRSLK